ncbi:hypothetical protein LOZ67_003804 [Ophidiomyces ophidiicola]|nr:hypothetical protein LOZ27_003963 [Ophidiomyces ophidiicola]KAI2154044.1 hypothetical protein LOZ25_005050 [Ophidiomyces ophidiicola]KAI2399460.1 hypothetical protein LOZ67_003804 [Ophidiomyces ophidiicola]KAI2441118.1 hypothetical protein LOZ30_002135 [Ophidiomyces ophidiicola]
MPPPPALALFSLHGQTAVVTGATRGIGYAMALALAEAGADLILVQRDAANTAARDSIARATGRDVTIHAADLADRVAVHNLIPALAAAGRRLHILLNCAGIQRRHPAHVFPDHDWDEINLTSVFTLCRAFGAYLLAAGDNDGNTSCSSDPPVPLPLPRPPRRRGAIINVASLLSFQGGVTVPAYAAAKGGVAQLTKALANEWAAHGIAVNAIAPGYVDTDMNAALLQDPARRAAITARIPLGRWAAPDDFKGVVVFLASEASAYVSGEVVCVDGGWMGR